MTRGFLSANMVLFRSDKELLKRTLRSLSDQERRPDVLRLLINDATDPGGSYLDCFDEWKGQLVVTDAAGGNIGFAGGHNLLLRQAFAMGADICLVLNPDVILYPESIALLEDTYQTLATRAILSGVLLLGFRDACGKRDDAKLIDSRGTVWTATGRHLDEDHQVPLDRRTLTGEVRKTASATGALLMVRHDEYEFIVTETTEFFDEHLFAYREDAELGIRAGLIGVQSMVLDVPVGVHYRSNIGVRRGSYVVDYLSTRNRFLIAMKFGRLRPGRLLPGVLRDLQVLVACLTVERHLKGVLREAWGLRHVMRQKHVVLRRSIARQKGGQP